MFWLSYHLFNFDNKSRIAIATHMKVRVLISFISLPRSTLLEVLMLLADRVPERVTMSISMSTRSLNSLRPSTFDEERRVVMAFADSTQAIDVETNL